MKRCPGCDSEIELGADRCARCDAEARTTETVGTPPLGDEPTAESIGEFRILRELGRGGMGVVYEAFQPSMNRTVALKVLDTALQSSDRDSTRFEREAWIGGRLSHPNIVKVYAHGTASGRRWFAMELVEGESLGAEIRKLREAGRGGDNPSTTRQRSDIHRIVKLFVEVAGALAVVHRKGIVHRDIKPLNLLLTPERDRLLLSDFGLAVDAQASRLTRRGDFLGTIRYMSPELLLAQRVAVDHRTDIWSFGVSLYEALTLELPFAGDSEEAYIASVSMRDAVDARRHNRAIPAELEAILCKCIERDPKNRYESAEQLRADLELFLEDRPPRHARRRGTLRRSIRLVRRHRKPLLAAVAAGILVVAVFGAWMAWRTERMEREWARSRLRILAEDDSKTGGLTDVEAVRLRRAVRVATMNDPGGETATLARRASLRLHAGLPKFALAKPKTPQQRVSLNLGVEPRFLTGVPFDYLVSWETSWDGQQFRTVWWCILDDPREGEGPWGGPLLADIAGTPVLSPVPHRLQVRSTVLYLRDKDRRGDPRLRDLPFGSNDKIFASGAPPATLLVAVEPDVIEKHVHEPRLLSISVFDDYPPDFPRPVTRSEAEATSGLCFIPTRVLVRYARVPVSSSQELVVHLQGRDDPLLFGSPPDSGHPAYLIVEVEWQGRDGKEGCTPLAGRQEVRTNLTQETVLSGDGVLKAGQHAIDTPCLSLNHSQGAIFGATGIITRSSICALRWVPGTPVVGSVEGTWSSTPSRNVALDLPDVEYYLAEPVSFPITIETQVVDSSWKSVPKH